MFRQLSRALAAAAAVNVALAVGASTPAAQASSACPATFALQHDDRIGDLQLPRGAYQVRVERVSCAQASSLFAAFLQDYDGRLPAGWRYTVRGPGRGLFTRSGTRSGAFAVALAQSSPGSGARPVTTLTCSSSFQILGDDEIGLLALPPVATSSPASAPSPPAARSSRACSRLSSRIPTGSHRAAGPCSPRTARSSGARCPTASRSSP